MVRAIGNPGFGHFFIACWLLFGRFYHTLQKYKCMEGKGNKDFRRPFHKVFSDNCGRLHDFEELLFICSWIIFNSQFAFKENPFFKLILKHLWDSKEPLT